MLVVNQKFYGANGEELSITKQDKLFTEFSNGQKFMTCEIDLKLKNEASTKAVHISNKIELERRKGK
jgi:hypothetical protein